MSEKYEPVRELAQRLYGVTPPPATVSRWVGGLKRVGRGLRVVRIGNRVLTTESELRSFLELGGQPIESESTQRKAKRSEKSREREVSAAEASCAADLS